MNADPHQPIHCGPGDSQPRVLFLIKSAADNEERRAAQHERWLKDLPAGAEHYFCISGRAADVPRVEGRLLLLPGHDGYDHLPAKMKRLVAWVAENSDHFDCVVTLDDDVVVEIGRLYDFLRHRPDHFGNRWDGDPAHISGMFVGYSMKAFHIMAGVIGSIPDTGPDDLLLGRAVREPFASLNVMTDCDRFKPYGSAATEATIAVEIRPFRAETMRDYRFPSGPSKRVSFCLFGSDPKYCQGALANVELIQRHYPGWEAVFYTKDVPAGVIGELRKQGATVVECAYANMMLARFLPFCEPGVVLSRDCDSRIGEREVRAVREWLASDKPAHIIRDHPEHIPGWATIPGGLWGSRLPFGERLRQALLDALDDPRYSGWGGDQRWLAENVWRADGFFIHQYNQVDWMRQSWNPNDFCGMRHEIPAPRALKEVVLFEGFFNRLNGLVNARLTHGAEFRVKWAVNCHLPHRFETLFDELPGVEVAEEEGLGYYPANTDPGKGPLCYWYVSRRNNTTAEEIAAAYRFILNRLKVSASGPPAALGIHFRGLHHAARATAEEFANWCVAEARARGIDHCFAIADSGRDRIGEILEHGGIRVTWGRSSPLRTDLDRSGFDDLRAFIGDALTLADCGTVLTSFAETTIVDPARAFGREVVAYSGSRAWSECWFHHSGGNGKTTRRCIPGAPQPVAKDGPLRILVAADVLKGKPHADWKEGYEAWNQLPGAISRSAIFTSIYSRDSWTHGSGPGSTPAYTAEYRKFLTNYMRSSNVKSVLDVGCGDWQFSQLVDWSGINYLGIDIVPEIIESHKREFGRENVRFEVLDLVDEEPPNADLVIIKDVLQHLSLASTDRILRKLSSFDRVLIAQDVSHGINHDCHDGGFRQLDVASPPFNLVVRKVFDFGRNSKIVYEWCPRLKVVNREP
jgi:SAM-dependent methyltransferase